MFKVEVGKPEDYKNVDKILWRAFEIDSKFEEDKREPWKEWAKEGFSKSLIIKDKNKIVANLTLENLNGYIRGSDMMVTGIGAVATEPTHRRKGMVRDLFKKAFQIMKEDGNVFSMLDPFDIDFYRKFGYANAETFSQFQFNPSNIIDLSVPDSISIREANIEDETNLEDLQYTSIRGGSRVFLTKSNIVKRIKTHNCYIIQDGGTSIGWFKLYFNRSKDHIDWEKQKLTLTVSLALFYNNNIALNALFNFLSGFAGQAHYIRINCPIEVPVQDYILDRSKLEISIQGSMMIRVIDFQGYVNTIKIPTYAYEKVIIKLEDEHCSWNSGTYILDPNEGKLIITSTDDNPEIIVSDQQFSRIISGLSSSKIMQSMGIIDCSEKVSKKLDAIFPKDSVMSYLRF